MTRNVVVPQTLRPSSGNGDGRDEPMTMSIMIDTVREDIKDIQAFHKVTFSEVRVSRLLEYLNDQLKKGLPSFHQLDHQEARTDYVLLEKYLQRQIDDLENLRASQKELVPILDPFSTALIELIERRAKVETTDGQYAAGILAWACSQIASRQTEILDGKLHLHGKDKRLALAGYRAAKCVDELHAHFQEWFQFYNGYDPMFTYWVSAPYETLIECLASLARIIRERLAGIAADDDDAIVGNPIGRHALLAALKSEVIPYDPEELVQIAEREYAWCEAEMIKASKDLGHGKDWRSALEQVKGMYVDPGKQTQLVHELAREAVDYVRDMVEVPRIAEENWRTFMMSPSMQKVAPFFLGGTSILISYPTQSMDHATKEMVMRGNSRPFARATVFHELIPGHHLQTHMIARYRPYRQLFMTPFWMEGWALYWEFILWDRDFAGCPENRIGMLFWRMHRCIRIIFSLSFHLGKMTPQECIDLLVDRVGHERATAEGEVRRSFNGDYGPLYQAGYMLGALQFRALRKEMVDDGDWSEKTFHDRILREGAMPVEILRALLQNKQLKPGYESSWRFYDI